MKLQKREWKMHQQLPKREENSPIPSTTKTTSHPWGKWSQPPKTWNEKHRKNSSCSPKAPTWRRMVRKNGKTWMHGKMAYVFGHFPIHVFFVNSCVFTRAGKSHSRFLLSQRLLASRTSYLGRFSLLRVVLTDKLQDCIFFSTLWSVFVVTFGAM